MDEKNNTHNILGAHTKKAQSSHPSRIGSFLPPPPPLSVCPSQKDQCKLNVQPVNRARACTPGYSHLCRRRRREMLMPPCVAGQAGKAHGERIEERRQRRGSPKETCTSRHPRKRVRSQAAAEGVRVGKACTAVLYRRHKEHGGKNIRQQYDRAEKGKNVPNIKANQHLAGTCGTRRKHAHARRRKRSSYI